jgi:hypothetical protein
MTSIQMSSSTTVRHVERRLPLPLNNIRPLSYRGVDAGLCLRQSGAVDSLWVASVGLFALSSAYSGSPSHHFLTILLINSPESHTCHIYATDEQ